MTKEEIINNINSMNEEQKEVFYNGLRECGIKEEAIANIQMLAFLTRMMNDTEMYKEVETTLAYRAYAEFNK